MKQPLKVLLISLIVVICSGIGIFRFVIQPKKLAIIQKESEYQELRDNLFGARYKLKNEKHFVEQIGKIETDFGKFNSILPRQDEITRLIQELPRLAEKNGVKVTSVRYQPFVKEEGYNRLSFSLPIEGQYSNIRRFIYEIETMRKVIWIEKLAIRASYSGKDDLTIQLTMSTYFI